MNHKPSQFCGPPTREGATLNVPLPQSATLSDMCEWTHCVWMSGLSAEEPGSSPPTRRPDGAPSSPPGGRGQESGCACRMCERMDGWVVCAWLRAWLGVCKAGWERMQRWGKRYKYNIWRETKLRNATNEAIKGFRKEFLPLKGGWSSKSLKGRTLDMKKKSSSQGLLFFFIFFYFFWVIKLVLIDTGQC